MPTLASRCPQRTSSRATRSGKGKDYVEITDEDLEAIDVESTRTIDIDQFVPRDEIDDLYINRPYYIVPDGKVGQQAFAVIREAMTGHFEPKKFEDRYEDALRDLIKRKAAGKEITPAKFEKPKTTTNLMDALRASLQGGNRPSASSARKRVSGKMRRAPAHGARSGRARKRRAG
jgi:non-homologous end joining protein Ku